MLRQDQLMAKIEASRANSEELRKNLHQLDQRYARERDLSAQPRARPKPFSQTIMDTFVPPH